MNVANPINNNRRRASLQHNPSITIQVRDLTYSVGDAALYIARVDSNEWKHNT
jgi:hypothetical protein